MDATQPGDLSGQIPAQSGELPRRRAGRVVVLDPGDRVLLFRYDDPPPGGRHWTTPGGGLEPGETYEAAARRELAEETGWGDIPLLGEIHRDDRVIAYRGGVTLQHERLFLARTRLVRRELGEVGPMHASDGITHWHWWTLPELDTTAELVWPRGLATLIRDVLGSARP
ncbi:MAG TPA: NUDIX domain-containing protein [Streptosporangiaceae bacterium]